jgi:hypothetical protein
MEGGGGLACHGRVTRQSLRQGDSGLDGPDQHAIGHHLEFHGGAFLAGQSLCGQLQDRFRPSLPPLG